MAAPSDIVSLPDLSMRSRTVMKGRYHFRCQAKRGGLKISAEVFVHLQAVVHPPCAAGDGRRSLARFAFDGSRCLFRRRVFVFSLSRGNPQPNLRGMNEGKDKRPGFFPAGWRTTRWRQNSLPLAGRKGGRVALGNGHPAIGGKPRSAASPGAMYQSLRLVMSAPMPREPWVRHCSIPRQSMEVAR